MRAIRIVFIGNMSVGKTQIISTFVNGFHANSTKPTLFENYSKIISIEEIDYRMFICDTGGMEDFYRLKRMAYLMADAFILCIDSSLKESIDSSKRWLEELKGTNKPIFLCLTKMDKKIEYDKEKVKNYSRKYKVAGVYECSMYKRRSIKRMFNDVAHFVIFEEPDVSRYRWCYCC